jgi:hypothetical protein
LTIQFDYILLTTIRTEVRKVMASSFFDRIDALAEMVGNGDLTGMVEVSQIYAAYQLSDITAWISVTPGAVRLCT